jgi:hypothetical protein
LEDTIHLTEIMDLHAIVENMGAGREGLKKSNSKFEN